MRILNLNSKFQPFKGGVNVPVAGFPSGCEPHVKLPEIGADPVLITCRVERTDDIFRLFLATDALRRSGTKNISAFIPYLPFARQDRVMVPGEPLSIKVLADLINSQNYDKVITFDLHNDVTAGFFNNMKVVSNHNFVQYVVSLIDTFRDKENIIVAPDMGAYKKIFSLCKEIMYQGEIVMCNKTRNLGTGAINSVTISHDDLSEKNCYIIDDICDGGATFTTLATELKQRGANSVNLIVSHGIFSKGLKPLMEIDRIWCTDSFQDIEAGDFALYNERLLHKVTQIKLSDCLSHHTF